MQRKNKNKQTAGTKTGETTTLPKKSAATPHVGKKNNKKTTKNYKHLKKQKKNSQKTKTTKTKTKLV